jgi:outer membrane protein assembly factor BamB
MFSKGGEKIAFSVLIFFAIMSASAYSSPVAIESAGGLLRMVTSNGTFEAWNVTTGANEERFYEGLPFISYDSAGANLYFGSANGTVLVTDAAGRIKAKINASGGRIFSVRADGDRLFTGSEEGYIRAWNISGNFSPMQSVKAHELSVNALYARAGRLYSASADGSIKIWDENSLILLGNLTTFEKWEQARTEGYLIWNMAVIGDRVFVGSPNGKMRIWSLTSSSLFREIPAHTRSIGGLATDGKYVYSCGTLTDNTLKMWTPDGWQQRMIVTGDYTPSKVAVDDAYVYLAVAEGGVLVYNKTDLSPVIALGDFSEVPSSAAQVPAKNEPALRSRLNPLVPIFADIFIFLSAAIVLEAIAYMKLKVVSPKEKKKSAAAQSFASIDDLMKILFAYLVAIFALAAAYPRIVFPNYVPGAQAIYYFDFFVRKGALMPLWFLLPAGLAYWATKKYDKKKRYIICLLVEIAAVAVYAAAPSMV